MPRPHRRPFRWPFRLALIAAAICIVLFAISLRKTVIIGLSGYGFMLTDGGVWLIHRSDFQHREFATTDAGGHLDWWPPCGFLRSQVFVRPGWSIDARLWFLAAANLAAAGTFVGLG
jgi:hypothetical protein